MRDARRRPVLRRRPSLHHLQPFFPVPSRIVSGHGFPRLFGEEGPSVLFALHLSPVKSLLDLPVLSIRAASIHVRNHRWCAPWVQDRDTRVSHRSTGWRRADGERARAYSPCAEAAIEVVDTALAGAPTSLGSPKCAARGGATSPALGAVCCMLHDRHATATGWSA